MDRLEPFAPGDIFVTASDLDPDARFPTGDGKVLQFAADWTKKAELSTGNHGLISSLHIDTKGNLHACDPQAQAITSIGPDGAPIAQFETLPRRGYGSMIGLANGEFLLGEHLIGETPGFSGDGKVYNVNAAGDVLRTFDTETNGGVGGFLGVTHMALSHDGETLFHTSETGPHVYAHDLKEDRRMGPIFTKQVPPPMVFGLAMLSDGRLAVGAGNALLLVDPQTGSSETVDLPEGRGWAVPIIRQAAAASAPETIFMLDFFAGDLAVLEIPSGKVLEQHELGLANCLTGLAVMPANSGDISQ